MRDEWKRLHEEVTETRINHADNSLNSLGRRPIFAQFDSGGKRVAIAGTDGPMGAALCSCPIKKVSTTSTGNYRAALAPMNCCWNRIRAKSQAIGPPMDAFCCSAASIRRRAMTC